MSLTLELLLDKCTSPDLPTEDWGLINKFVQAVKDEGDSGAQGAIQIILDKMRAKNPKAACYAITVLESVVKSCGEGVHAVVGKFRFLNELIKMVSPKYYADTPAPVKERIYCVFVQWNFSLVNAGKVREAYQMLVKQGVVFPANVTRPELQVPCGPGYLDVNANRMTTRESPLEENKKQAALLAKLLKSKDPNDLMKANRLIKKMADQDAKRNEQAANVMKELDIVKTNIRLLTEMVNHFNPAMDGPLDKNEVLKDLYQSCETQRPKMFSMARELDQKEDVLGEVLAVNDDLTRAMDAYNVLKERQSASGAAVAAPSAGAGGNNLLGDDVMISSPTPAQQSGNSGGLGSLLDLDFGAPAPAPQATQPVPVATGSNDLLGGLGGLDLNATPAAAPAPVLGGGLGDLFGSSSMSNGAGGVGIGLMQAPQPSAVPPVASSGLDMLGGLGGMTGISAPAPSAAPAPSLGTVNMDLQSIQPGTFPPATIHDQNNVRVLLNFAKNPPHPSICVVVVTMLNMGNVPVNAIQFQAAVPKTLEVKLQPPSAAAIPPANPMAGPSVVTQIMLLSNPTKGPIKIRFKLSYNINGQAVDQMGECDQFPPM